jgi:hypothetical protein
MKETVALFGLKYYVSNPTFCGVAAAGRQIRRTPSMGVLDYFDHLYLVVEASQLYGDSGQRPSPALRRRGPKSYCVGVTVTDHEY